MSTISGHTGLACVRKPPCGPTRPETSRTPIREEWKAHLPSPAVADVKAAATAARKADAALDDAVRLDGASWAAVGDAAGMTRQARP
jgi:hypothetical protein